MILTRAQTRALETPCGTPDARAFRWIALLHCRHYAVSLTVHEGRWHARAALLDTRGDDTDRHVDVTAWTDAERRTAENVARRTLEGVGAAVPHCRVRPP